MKPEFHNNERDLFGNPLPPTPAMDAPLPWCVYVIVPINGPDQYWIARSLKEAKECFLEDGLDTFASAQEVSIAEQARIWLDRRTTLRQIVPPTVDYACRIWPVDDDCC